MKRKLTTLAIVMAFLTMTTIAMAADFYATANGKKYHKEGCTLVKNKSPEKISQKIIDERGLAPCGKCFKAEQSRLESKGSVKPKS